VPDLVLLDFLMPHVDGLQTLKNLRATEGMHQTPIVLYTAAATEAQQLMATEGVQAVLFKPLPATDLLKAVRDLIGDAGS
jgi:CheY-like chemotaxis protein